MACTRRLYPQGLDRRRAAGDWYRRIRLARCDRHGAGGSAHDRHRTLVAVDQAEPAVYLAAGVCAVARFDVGRAWVAVQPVRNLPPAWALDSSGRAGSYFSMPLL